MDAVKFFKFSIVLLKPIWTLFDCSQTTFPFNLATLPRLGLHQRRNVIASDTLVVALGDHVHPASALSMKTKRAKSRLTVEAMQWL